MHHQVSYRWSMLSVSVSFTHTIKTLGPMFTIFFSRLLLSERMSFTRLLSVLPVVLGVAITTSTEVEFALVPPTRTYRLQLGLHACHRSPHPAAQRSAQSTARPAALSPQPNPRQVGFCCAMSSTVCQVRLHIHAPYRLPDTSSSPTPKQLQPRQRLNPPPSTHSQALQSVLSKQALADGRVSKPELFCVAALYALLLLLPLFALLEAWRLPRWAASWALVHLLRSRQSRPRAPHPRRW